MTGLQLQVLAMSIKSSSGLCGSIKDLRQLGMCTPGTPGSSLPWFPFCEGELGVQ